jgi:hypothetical protein
MQRDFCSLRLKGHMIKRHVNLVNPHYFHYTIVGETRMKPSPPALTTGTCCRCGECCRWLPIVLVRQCKPHQVHYFRERGLKEADGLFLAYAPCRHLHEEEHDSSGTRTWGCTIYDSRPATCRDFCGKTLSGGKRYYVPESCTMSGKRDGEQGVGKNGTVSEPVPSGSE